MFRKHELYFQIKIYPVAHQVQKQAICYDMQFRRKQEKSKGMEADQHENNRYFLSVSTIVIQINHEEISINYLVFHIYFYSIQEKKKSYKTINDTFQRLLLTKIAADLTDKREVEGGKEW